MYKIIMQLKVRVYWQIHHGAKPSAMPYSGFCLQGPNLCELCELLWARKFQFCSYSCTFVSAHCTYHSSVVVISLSYVSVQVLQKRDTSALLPDPKAKARITMVMWIMYTMTLQHFSNVANSSKNPCRHSILWSQSL